MTSLKCLLNFLEKVALMKYFFLISPQRNQEKRYLKFIWEKGIKKIVYNIGEIADSMEGYTGADIEAVVKELIEMALLR